MLEMLNLKQLIDSVLFKKQFGDFFSLSLYAK